MPTFDDWLFFAATIPVALFIEYGIGPIAEALARIHYAIKLKRKSRPQSSEE